MPRRSVIICVAIQLEADAVSRALQTVPDVSARVQIVGIGGGNIPERFDPAEVSLVISAGLAGALDPNLKCGDVIEDDTRTRIHTADRVVATVEQKAELFRTTGAAAVDMETGGIARVAKESGVRFVAIRAISDSALDAIDPAILGLVDAMGKPRLRNIAAVLLRRPRLIPELLRLRSASKLALRNLGKYLATYLQEHRP
jgi:adenosylhomocysteine nucleosidase